MVFLIKIKKGRLNIMNNNDYQKMIEKINQQEKELLNQFHNNINMIEKIKESAKLQKLAALLGVNNG
tara:strand:- start:1042 stop:1242 length:201 start_codon:yes stop_codon:yes gene_type:complete